MFHFFKKAAATVANAAAGKLRLFADTTGAFKVKDENGNVVVLGNGITGISLVGTIGLVKTYRITLQDGSTYDYAVTNGTDGTDGRSIVSVTRTNGTGAAGTTDTYTIAYNKAPLSSTFTVYNGANGTGTPANAAPPAVAAASSMGTTTAEYALEDHTHAGVTSIAVNGGAAQQGPIGLTIPSAYTDEMAQDAVGAALAAGADDGVSVTYDDAGNSISIVNTDKGSTAVASHNAQTDPHPQYLTPAEADAMFATPAEAAAAAPVQSVAVNGGAAQTGAVSVNARLLAIQSIVATGAITLNAATTYCYVRAVGGGGGGGGGAVATGAGSGGASGGYAEGLFTRAQVNGITATIGTAGAAGTTTTAGTAGGTTTLGAILSCTGGGLGTVGAAAASKLGGTGGQGSGGNINLRGDPGKNAVMGTTATWGFAGSGGCSPFGGAGLGGAGAATVAGTAAAANSGSGGGGGLGVAAGGAGGTGYVVIYEYA